MSMSKQDFINVTMRSMESALKGKSNDDDEMKFFARTIKAWLYALKRVSEMTDADSESYIINPPYTQPRVEHEVYERAEAQTSKWEPIEPPPGFASCSNVCPDFDREAGKFIFRPPRQPADHNRYPGMYEVISSALLLYRLLCLFKAPVETEGPNGYKCIWWINLKHQETGEILRFGEWKGAAGVWTRFRREEELPESYKRDMLLLMDELVAEDCPHPYDGNIAGSVA